MRFQLPFRDSERLTFALLFSLVLHALLLFFIRFAQPSWKDSANKTTALNVILEKKVAEAAPQPADIPQASRNSKGTAKIGVQAANPAPQKTHATVTLAQNEQHNTKPRKVIIDKKILAIDKPAKFTVAENTAELQVTKSLPPEITEEKAKPLAPAPSVDNSVAKVAPPIEEPKKIVTVEPAVEKPEPAKVEEPKPIKVEEPKPVKAEEPKPVKIEEPKPIKVEEPKPVKVEAPKPVRVEEPKPVKVEEPKPVRVEEPKPVKVEEPKPVKVEEPKPVKVEAPKPAKVEEPQPVKVEAPKPAIAEESKPIKPEVAAGPKTSPSEGGKSDGDRARPPGYTTPSQSELGIGVFRSLPKIADKRIMFGERRKIVGVREQELRYAMYIEGVRLKLERIGQFNYPAAAAKNNLSGTLTVQFSIRPDGSLEEFSIVRPSPHEVLDAGAEKIVKMCAPFSPLPENIRRDTDILTIRINWNFSNSRQALD
jgi:protein TonB